MTVPRRKEVIFDQMIEQLAEERVRVQIELEKIESAIRSINDLKTHQLDRGIVGPLDDASNSTLIDIKSRQAE